jgi:hypothetical protein
MGSIRFADTCSESICIQEATVLQSITTIYQCNEGANDFPPILPDAMNGRYPLDAHERAYLIALRIQSTRFYDST